MSLELLSGILEEYSGVEMLKKKNYVNISGGEPLTHRDFEAVYELVVAYQGFFMMPTSGIGLKQYQHLFKAHDTIQISVDGDREIHDWIRGAGVYDKMIDGIQSLKDTGVRPYIGTVIFNENKDHLEDILDFVERFNCKGIQFGPFIPTAGLNHYPGITPLPNEEFREVEAKLVTEARERGILCFGTPQCIDCNCEAQVSLLSVEPDGTYVDCPMSHNILGKYPDRMQMAVRNDLVAQGKYQNPVDTCLRWL
jgi:MoaA/NifB/PqqE/SkfB family radical SAM enzyme